MILCYIIIYYTILCFLVLHYIQYIFYINMNEKLLAPLASPFPASTCCQRAKSCMVLVSQSARSIGKSWQNYIICCNLYTHSCSAYYFVHSTQYHRIESSQTLACYSSHLILSCLPGIHYLYLFVLCYLPVHQSMHACMPPRSGVGMHLKLHL